MRQGRRKRWAMTAACALLLLAACGRDDHYAGPWHPDTTYGHTSHDPPVAAPAGPATSASAAREVAAAVDPNEKFGPPVYTAAQAAHGEELYRAVCARCHTTVQHSGSSFAAAWANRRVSSLYDILATTMPQDSPGSLTSTQYADITAYLMKLNGFPAGAVALRPDSAMLRHMRITLSQPAG